MWQFALGAFVFGLGCFFGTITALTVMKSAFADNRGKHTHE